MHHLMRIDEDEETILKVEIGSDAYFFGLGLKDCDNISLTKLKKLYKDGTWYLYTWAA